MPEETRETGRGWRVVLVASLALNLAVLGAAGGWVLRHGLGPDHRHGPHAARMAQMGGPLTRALDAEGRDAVAAQLRSDGAAQGARRAALRASLEALLADLRARPFDPARVEARLAAQRAQVTGRLEAGHAALLTHLAGMSDAGRAAYADRLEETLRHWRARHHR